MEDRVFTFILICSKHEHDTSVSMDRECVLNSDSIPIVVLIVFYPLFQVKWTAQLEHQCQSLDAFLHCPIRNTRCTLRISRVAIAPIFRLVLY